MSPVCLSGGRWRDCQDRRSRGRNTFPAPHPRARSREGKRETASGALGRPGRVGGAERLRRSRWERGSRERAGREGIRPAAGCGRAPHESGSPRDLRAACAKMADVFSMCLVLSGPGALMKHKSLSDRGRECGLRGQGPGGLTRPARRRAGSFNQEEPRSSRFRSYGPSLREERYRPVAKVRRAVCWWTVSQGQVSRVNSHESAASDRQRLFASFKIGTSK